jgi:hypothetical protein
MSSVLGIFAIGLMVIVLVIAAASLVIVGTLPFARWWQRRRVAQSNRADTST